MALAGAQLDGTSFGSANISMPSGFPAASGTACVVISEQVLLPAIYEAAEEVEAGGLMSYGVNVRKSGCLH